MTQPGTSDLAIVPEAKLPRRDWILLPLLSFLTICLLAGSTECIARRMFSGSTTTINSCLIVNDSPDGVRAIPNSMCLYKIPEGPPVEYSFNSSGYRASMDCSVKRPDTYRIVMVGSSLAMGWGVPREKTFGALLPAAISRETGRKVELCNQAMMYEIPRVVARRFHETLAAKPDLILWIVTYLDVEHVASAPVVRPVPPEPSVFMGKTRRRVKEALAEKSISGAVSDLSSTARDLMDSSETKYLLRHFMYKSQSQYLKSHLEKTEGGIQWASPSAEWQSRLLLFDIYAADIEARARASGVPLVAVLVPNRPQAAMISLDEWPAGYDPFRLDNELRSIVTRYGGIYIDILPEFRSIPNPEQYYFPVDGHPDSEGHAMIASFLAKELTGGAVPELRADMQPKAPQEAER